MQPFCICTILSLIMISAPFALSLDFESILFMLMIRAPSTFTEAMWFTMTAIRSPWSGLKDVPKQCGLSASLGYGQSIMIASREEVAKQLQEIQRVQ
jgi:hypothetical protein